MKNDELKNFLKVAGLSTACLLGVGQQALGKDNLFSEVNSLYNIGKISESNKKEQDKGIMASNNLFAKISLEETVFKNQDTEIFIEQNRET